MPALIISCSHVSAVGSQLVQWDSPIIAVNLPSKPLYFGQQIVVLATVDLNRPKQFWDYKAGGREEHEARLNPGLGKFHLFHFSISDNSPNPKLRAHRRVAKAELAVARELPPGSLYICLIGPCLADLAHIQQDPIS